VKYLVQWTLSFLHVSFHCHKDMYKLTTELVIIMLLFVLQHEYTVSATQDSIYYNTKQITQHTQFSTVGLIYTLPSTSIEPSLHDTGPVIMPVWVCLVTSTEPSLHDTGTVVTTYLSCQYGYVLLHPQSPPYTTLGQ